MKNRRYIFLDIKSFFVKSSIIFFLITIIFSGCKHKLEDDDVFGQEYTVAPEDIHTVGSFSASQTSYVDFRTDKVNFSANLSSRVSWTIAIIGSTSKAEKIIDGLSQVIDMTNASWDGASSNDVFFLAGETCVVTLSFLGSDVTYTFNITIGYEKMYDGILISDFEGGVNGLVANNQWFSYSDSEISGTDVISKGVKNSIFTPQGSSYYHMRGIDQMKDYYIGGFGNFNALTLDPKLAALSSNLNDIYINMYVNSNGTTNTLIGIRIHEDENYPLEQDVFYKDVLINWTGWKLVSIKLSDFVLEPFSTKPGGNKVMNRLDKIAIYPAPAVPGVTCEIDVDYIIFTKGPFKH